MIKRVNIGCGSTPTKGWINYDNSPSINIAASPIKYFLLRKLHLLNASQIEYIEMIKKNRILFADATKKLPFHTNEVQCIYSSHMLEHLSKRSANSFLKECLRILSPNGVLRLVLPDLRKLVNSYLADGDADLFIEDSFLIPPSVETLRDKFKLILVGYRQHQWMYDSKSLTKIVLKAGFRKVLEQKPGYTCINNYGELDLLQRSEESFYIEAIK